MLVLDERLDNRLPAFIANRLPSSSFYSHIRNAAIMLKLHGLFPFENLHSDDGRSLSFKWFSWSTLWGFSLYTGSAIVLGLLSLNRTGSRAEMCAYVLQSSLYYCCHLCNYRKFPRLLQAMEYINDKFVALNERVKPRLRVSTLAFWVIFEIVAVTVMCLRAVINLLSDPKPIPATEFALTVLMATINSYLELYISIMFLVMTALILFYYERLNRRVDDAIHVLQIEKMLLENLENLRILHSDLMDASNYLLEWFSLTMTSLVFSLVLRTLVKAVFIFFITRKISLTNDFILLLSRFVYIFILTTATHKLVKSCRLTILQTTIISINSKAFGLFTMSRPLLPCMLSAIILFVIVIIELEKPLRMLMEAVDSKIIPQNQTN